MSMGRAHGENERDLPSPGVATEARQGSAGQLDRQASSAAPPAKGEVGKVTSALPDIILAADWSSRAEDRAVWRADVAKRSVRRLSWRGKGLGALLDQARKFAGASRRVLIALDAALGLPAAAWKKALDLEPEGNRPTAFPEWLKRRKLEEIGRKSSRPEDWSPRSPFLTLPKGRALDPFVNEVGVARLKRRVDGIAAAKLPFVSGLPGFVGATSQYVWCELIAMLESRDWGFWPFDGEVASVLQNRGTVLAEAYPAVIYRVVLPGRPTPTKSCGRSRAEWLDALGNCDWIQAKEVEVRDILAAEVNENEFDACAMSLAILRLVLEGESLESEWSDHIAEGGILGLGAAQGRKSENQRQRERRLVDAQETTFGSEVKRLAKGSEKSSHSRYEGGVRADS